MRVSSIGISDQKKSMNAKFHRQHTIKPYAQQTTTSSALEKPANETDNVCESCQDILFTKFLIVFLASPVPLPLKTGKVVHLPFNQ